MPTLDYTSVDRVYNQEPAIESISDLSSSHVYTFGEDAEAEVNAALAKNYTIPVTGSPPILQAIATDICIYRILSRRVFSQERLQLSTWPDSFKEARELLKSISDGTYTLVGSDGDVIGARTDLAKVTSNNKDFLPTFSELGPLGSIMDDNKVDSLLDDMDEKSG